MKCYIIFRVYDCPDDGDELIKVFSTLAKAQAYLQSLSSLVYKQSETVYRVVAEEYKDSILSCMDDDFQTMKFCNVIDLDTMQECIEVSKDRLMKSPNLFFGYGIFVDRYIIVEKEIE